MNASTDAPDGDDDARPSPMIRVFGGVGVEGADGPVSIGGRRQRRLLALLAIRSDTVVDIDWLAEYLWNDGDRPDVTAPPLRTYVSRLRSSFPEEARAWIVTEPDGYRLAAGADAVEHLRFARLRAAATRAREHEDPQTAQRLLDEALDLWRGDPFRELEDLDWVAADVERLRLDRLEMLEERWESALALGRHTQITGELAAFTAEHGSRDRSARQYALALHRSGQTGEALQVIADHRKVLVEEFGLDPSREILELQQALLSDDPSLVVEKEGRPLRGYRLLEEIGSGAFSVVWRGVQPSVGREVAIKQIRSGLASQPEFIRRFETEAHLVARIEHPYVVPLIDFWRDPDSAYLVMRWLRGGTLERRLDDGPLSVDETLAMARQIGGALAAAHAHGIVHRDVKTANILFDEQGNAYLTDFGIALEASKSSGPEAALSPGSPAYSSPEQIRQERLGPASDVFSLGVVLFEALTGSLPFTDAASLEEVIELQLSDPYPALTDLRADVPGALSDAVARATAKDAGHRFDSVAAFLEALDRGALDAVGDASIPNVAGSDAEIANPYQGLLAFDDADADRFFGRERLVRELVGRLSGTGVASRSVIVVGPSGSGKSSVVRAGLVPVIRAGEAPGSADWFVTTMVPGTDPYEALEAALLRIAINPPPSLIEQLRSGSRGILRSVRRCLRSDGERVALVIDQFEEIFTASSRQDAHDFLEALSVAVEDPSTPLRLIATLRADYYDRPLEHPAFAQVLDASTVNVTPLAGDELERAIVEPARGVGVDFEPGLVARIAAETVGQPSSLPLLQYTLSELFERRSGRQMTTSGYDELGGLTGALASRAEAIHAEADVAQRSAIRRVFGSLTNPGEESADLRRRVRLGDLGDDPETTWVLDSYGTARLLTFDRDVSSREPTVEVAHEALMREWPRLATWLAEDAEVLRVVAAIAGAAARWQVGGREGADLYRGSRLQRATELVASDSERLAPLDREFVEASQAHAEAITTDERNRGRRVRALAVGVVVAIVLAVGFGGLAIVQQGRADDEARTAAEARGRAELATLITSSAEASDPDVGLLLALEAQRRAPGPETDRSLLSALRRRGSSRTVASFPALAQGPCSGWAGLVSRDGMLQTSNRNGIAVSRDLTSGEMTEHSPMPGGCGTWYGDEESGRRYATNESEDKLWLGPFDGPWEREVVVPAGSFVRGPKAFGAERLVLENPATAQAQLLDSRTGAAIGAPIEGLSDAPPRLSPDGSMLAVARTGIPGSDAPSVAVHDAETGSLLIEADVAGQPQMLHFDIATGHLLVATADSRLVTVDLTDGDILGDIRFDGGQLYNLGLREDGLVMAISAGDPGTIELLDRHTGLVREETIELDDLRGGVMRSDGHVLTWGFDFAVDVLDIDNDVLADVSIATGLVDLSPSAAGPNVILIGEGRAVLWEEGTTKSVAVDLATGRQTTIDAVLADGGAFDVDGPAWPLEDGYLLLGKQPEVAFWRDGRIIDTLVLSTGENETWEGVNTDGSRALAGISGDDGVVVHLLDFRGGRIDDAFRITVDEVAFGWPTADGGMGIILPDGTAQRYDASGEVIDEFLTGLGDWEHFGAVASDGNGKIALARATSANGFRSLDIVDLDARSVTKLPIVSPVSDIGFARGGDLMIIKHDDGSVRGWDIDAGESIGILWQGTGVSFGPPHYEASTDSVWVASVDRIVRLPLSRDVWRDRACERIGRDFTEEEWSTLVPGGEPYSPACS